MQIKVFYAALKTFIGKQDMNLKLDSGRRQFAF